MSVSPLFVNVNSQVVIKEGVDEGHSLDAAHRSIHEAVICFAILKSYFKGNIQVTACKLVET